MSGAPSALHRLAERAGILSEYRDQTGNLCRTSDETRRALLAAVGIDASTDAAAVDALAALDDGERDELIAPVVVARTTDDDARVLCRSALPYTLDLLLHAERRDPTVLETSLAGDLAGWVRWRLTAVDGGTRMDFAQEVRVTGRLLGAASYVARPVLRWNHDRMMAGCLDGLQRRLATS